MSLECCSQWTTLRNRLSRGRDWMEYVWDTVDALWYRWYGISLFNTVFLIFCSAGQYVGIRQLQMATSSLKCMYSSKVKPVRISGSRFQVSMASSFFFFHYLSLLWNLWIPEKAAFLERVWYMVDCVAFFHTLSIDIIHNFVWVSLVQLSIRIIHPFWHSHFPSIIFWKKFIEFWKCFALLALKSGVPNGEAY